MPDITRRTFSLASGVCSPEAKQAALRAMEVRMRRLVVILSIALHGCSKPTPTGSHWLASPAQQFGVPDNTMMCFSGNQWDYGWPARRNANGDWVCFESDNPMGKP